MTALDEPRTGTLHPLEPLTAEEVTAASTLLREARGLADTARFVFVHLHEPSKRDLASGDALPRRRSRA